MITHPETTHRRLARAATLCTGAAFLLGGILAASPAQAEVPEGWSNPDEVSTLYVVLVFGGIPLALTLLITLAVHIPALVRGEKLSTGSGTVESQWFGGPSTGTAELAAPDDGESQAGGASARW